jgi:threonine 3-dehydrogenase
MRKEVVLVTGASGEMGQALICRLAENGVDNILALDVRAVPEAIRDICYVAIQGDLLDSNLMNRLVAEYSIPRVFHLAALLSTRAEFTPEAAHHVNVDGTLGLLKLAVDQSSWLGCPVKFIFPSSIAAYGLPDLETKANAGAVKEWAWNNPTTMYGCNKLYAEQLGRYYANHYRQLAVEQPRNTVDFRAIRFPGLISAMTVPSGGTSDYGPEMLHAAARGVSYACFVREDTQMPFMAMPDAVKSLLMLADAPRENLNTYVYNVTSFSLTARQFYNEVKQAFPGAQITFEPDPRRQGIVDSWPEDQDDSRARRDWGWSPDYDLRRAFDDYLVPNITRRYAG